MQPLDKLIKNNPEIKELVKRLGLIPIRWEEIKPDSDESAGRFKRTDKTKS